MLLKIVIPTLNRLEKLKNCINSIIKAKRNFNVELIICFSNLYEIKTIKSLFKQFNWIKYKLIKNYKVPEFWNSFCKELKKDECLMYLNDDIVLKDDTIKYTFELYPKFFPNFDGVVGIRQENIPENQALPTAFGIIGYKFTENFPNKEILCPEYFRFYADRELYLYTTKTNKFKFSSVISLIHYHPAFYKHLADDTHKKVRLYWNKDHQTYLKRQELGYIWGINFFKLKKENK